jgi:hypothetical protein
VGLKSKSPLILVVLAILGCSQDADTEELVYRKVSSTIEGDSLKEELRIRVNPWTSSIRYIQEGGSLGKEGRTLVALPVQNIEQILPGSSESECTVYDKQNWTCFLEVKGPIGIENQQRWTVRNDTLAYYGIFTAREYRDTTMVIYTRSR